MKTSFSITFVDENDERYERSFAGIEEGQKIKATLKFPTRISSFELLVKAINEEGKQEKA